MHNRHMNMENPKFLADKYNTLHTAKEVERSVENKEKTEGEKIPQKKEAKIASYLERLDNISKTKRGSELLEHILTKDFVLDVKNEDTLIDLARALYESEKKIAIERGQGGQIEELEASDSDLLDKYKNAILEKYEIQKKTLGEWFNYLKHNDANYPMWFRYFVVRSLSNMGQFSRDEKRYSNRTGDTIAPFPELNAEALGFVYKALQKQFEIDEIKNDNKELGKTKQDIKQEKLDEYLKGVTLDEERRIDLEKELTNRLLGKDFAKLYAFAQVETAGSLNRESLDGKWTKYNQGSDYQALERGLQGKGTGWCTAEGSAKGQIEQGDFYVYYTKSQNGYTEPRIAIRMAGDQIAEVRGVNPKQELEPELVDTAKEMYKDLPGAQKYEKADHDMKFMTSIYNKCFNINKETGEHMYIHQELTKDELVFIYELNSSISGFGYEPDPRIQELRSNRNLDQDLPVIFECNSEQIARNINEVNKETKAYIGEWNPDVYNKLPENIEYLYENFPEKKIFKRDIELSTKTSEQYTKEIKSTGASIYDYAQDMLDKLKPLDKNESVKLVSFSVEQLGYPEGATLEKIYKKANELGFDLCDPHVGPELRLNYTDQPSGEYLYIAMNSITDRDDYPGVFHISRGSGGEVWLLHNYGQPDYKYSGNSRFVFSPRKKLELYT